jgi:small-conductance mechanosensitive channel
MRDCEAVAPLNTEYRKLKERLEETDAVWSNVLRITGIAVVLLVVLQQFFAWRARAKVAALGGPALATGGKKNKFLDD